MPKQIKRKSKRLEPQKSIDNIYTQCILTHSVSIAPKYFNTNFKERVYYKLKKLEGACLGEGYIKKNSIEILSIKENTFDIFNFSGTTIVNVEFKADVCNPIVNSKINCYVESINEFGIKATVNKDKNDDSPLYILITKEHNNEKLNDIKIGNKLTTKIIGKKYNLYDSSIFVIGLII